MARSARARGHNDGSRILGSSPKASVFQRNGNKRPSVVAPWSRDEVPTRTSAHAAPFTLISHFDANLHNTCTWVLIFLF